MASLAAHRPCRRQVGANLLVVIVIVACCLQSCLSAPVVSYITPRQGSLRGATRVEIYGSGFSNDPFSFGEGNEDKGNRVWFVNETTSVECDVINYFTNEDKIVCDTRSASAGYFDVYIEVDGQSIEQLGGQYCSRSSNCQFEYKSGRTPTISSVTPTYNVPGSPVTIRGRIFTEYYDSLQFTEKDTEDYDDDYLLIYRIYWGPQIICDPEDPATEELYGIELDSEDSQYGEIICRPDSNLVGSYRLTYLVSGTYGRSLSEPASLYVSGEHKLYHYQTHADVATVSPQEGSLSGGTDVVIEGSYFDYTDPDLAVLVGGIPCDIYNVSSTEILCRTNPANERVLHSNATVFPGARGITREVWHNTYGDLRDDSLWNTSAPDYCSETREFSSSPDYKLCSESDQYISRLRGFFVPPSDGNYSFLIYSDDESILYLSQTPFPSDKEEIAGCPHATNSFTRYEEQTSGMMYLQAGENYYFEARMREWGGNDYLKVGVFIFDTPLIASQYSGVISEEQSIFIDSDVQNEVQSITYGAGLHEVQEIRVGYGCVGIFCDDDDESWITTNSPTSDASNSTSIPTTANYTSDGNSTANMTTFDDEGSGDEYAGSFILAYGGETTDELEVGASALEVEIALNGLANLSATPVEVTSYQEGDTTVYRVVFASNYASYPLIEDATNELDIQVNITRATHGHVNGTKPSQFQILYDGQTSSALTFDSTEDEVRDAILDMMKVKCTSSGGGKPHYSQDYESAAVGNEYGTRVIDQEPFCGRTSILNPTWIFYEGVMGTAGSFDLRYISNLCFAHRGYGLNGRFYVWVSWIDKDKSSRFDAFNVDVDFVRNDDWQHVCIDLYDHFKLTWINNAILSGTGISVERIRLYQLNSDDFYIDNIHIGSREDSYDMRIPAVKPNGNFILDVQVEAVTAGFSVEFEPAHCGYAFPLIGISEADINAGSTESGSDAVVFSSGDWEDGASAMVQSVQRATPPVFGTFSLAQVGGGVVRDISGQATAAQMKDMLETFLDTGDLEVTREGSCKGFTWNIKWVGKGGNQGDLVVVESNLYNNVTNVTIAVEQLADGGVFLDEITGEFLRTANDQPQVEVIVNGIPSSCHTASCSFEYTPEATPSVTSVIPSRGSAHDGTSVVILGSGFGSYSSQNNVTIGGADCMVTFGNESRIECDVGEAQGGVYNISVVVEGRGTAALPAGGAEFEYTFNVTGVTPDEGSVAGGTEVVISGYGLGGSSEVEVSFGSYECLVVSASYDEVTCRIVPQTSSRRRRSTLTADLYIAVNGITVTVADVFTFNSSLTPTVTGVDPEYSSVLGGGNMTITGYAFGSSGATVTLGGQSCEVLSQTSTSIVCEIPAGPPGDYEVEVNIDGVGTADTSSVGFFSYLLKVSGIFPARGSLQGGTTLTMKGAGFGSDSGNISVTVGGYDCEVTAVADSELTCVTTSSSTTHFVDNMGRHATFGRGYKWNPQHVTASTGDSVTWSWTIDPYVNGIGYAVQQTEDGDSVAYDGTGFYSGGRSTSSGSYTYKFDAPGLYYYSSGPVNNDATLYMKGVIEVLAATSRALEVDVSIGGYSANHNTSSGMLEPDSNGGCSPENETMAGCSTTVQTSSSNSSEDRFLFAYHECMTPIISSVSPLIGDSSDTIVIEGSGFSADDCNNEVTVGRYPCTVSSSSESRIECTVDTQDQMEVGVYHEININVANRGNNLHEVAVLANRSFVMFPRIDSVSDDGGSLQGGLTLELTGDGFAPASPSNIGVYVGSSVCNIQFYNYTYIACITPSSASYSTATVRVQIDSLWAVWATNNTFSYREEETPVVMTWSPGTVTGASTSMTFSGSNLTDSSSDVTIYVGGERCSVTSASLSQIDCDVGFVPVGTRFVTVNIAGKGYAQFFHGNDTVTSLADISAVTPAVGSTEGGQVVNITGNGFVVGSTLVTIDGDDCVIQSISLSEISCITPANSAGSYDLVVTSDGETYSTQSYVYSSSSTPTITSVSPSSGETGDSITISGSAFSNDTADVSVTIDGVECTVTSASTSTVQCNVGAHSAGIFDVEMYVDGLGIGDSDETFEYVLTVSSISPSAGSFGGGQMLLVSGSGFDDTTTTVTVCGNVCPLYHVNETDLECDVPGNSDSSNTLDCDVIVRVGSGSMVNESSAYTYRRDMTPVITSVYPARGGTGGGTTLTIIGSDFLDSDNNVTIAGTPCNVLSENSTVIVCQTGAHSPSEMAKVRVQVGSDGIATQDNADYFYIDVWSSIYTWGGNNPPVEGDFVIVPAGQTLLLDVTTPILSVLLIQGGEVIFDEADIELHAEYVVVVDGGHFQIGTEEEPFQHEASVVMHGHVRSIELPLFGAKTFAVRNGTVDMHGIPTPITWTYLAETVNAGDTELTLMDAVNWRVGDHIVLASTGTRHKQRENEEVEITDVSNDNMTISFTPAAEYEHISISQVVDGVLLETRGEVGLLTHNVKIRGSVHEDWVEEVEACPDEFDTNQFATQTCFQGRFGAETVTDQFGSQIMFFAKEQDQHLVRGRFEYVEVTHAGQAFRLGRYPIHFHMNGDVTGSYVRGCGIHHTFNRAVTIHGVHNFLVEHNVAFNVMGHAYFLEDGIETKNIIQYNLAVFVRPSSSLLNVDVTPAAFWVTNADNYIRHNAAAGGSHFGFWYNLPSHPGGPSFTTSVCPRRVPVLEFYNNTAHTQGWYGIWIFPSYFPADGGQCGGSSAPAKFYNLTAWRTERGAEGVQVGAIQFHNFLMADNDEAGIEFQTVSGPWGEEGPLVKDSVIIGYSPELAGNASASRCTSSGIQLPKSKFLTVDGVKMINFDEDRCATLRACGHCKPNQGGFQHRFKNMEFTNAPNKAAFKWEHETWFEDLDGTLTGMDADYIVTPTNFGLPTDHCTYDVEDWSVSSVGGAVCDDTVKLHRMAFNQAAPSSLQYKNTLLTNSYGTTVVPWRQKRLTHPEGWMLTLVEDETYNFYFENVDHVTNISYVARFDEFDDGDYVIMNHNFTQSPDAFALTGQVTENVGRMVTYDDDENADWYFNNATNNLYYLISGKGQSSLVDRSVDLDVYRCYYKDCIPPVPEAPPAGRPSDVLYWGSTAAWADVPEGWGGHPDTSVLPQNGDDVMIMPGLWVVTNGTLPWMNKLFIYGTLEIDDTKDWVLNCTYILIQGGRLIAGFNETQPFTHDLRILLNGHHFTQDIPLPNGPNLGSKALGVFGTLDLHGMPREVTWTHLAATVEAGDSELTVAVDTDWVVGDEIVVTSTSFEAWQTETFRISSKSDSRTFGLNGTFAYKHSVESGTVNGKSYHIAAEVGLLSRNIVIEGNDYNLLFDESFGARTIVGTFIQDGEFYRGSGHIANVEFKLTGQEGWTDFYDPRYSLAFLDIGDVLEDPAPSYVHSCAFHNGFSPAIGVFGTDNIEVDNNVIHHTVGAGIISYGENTIITNNLVTLMVFPGTYQDRFETDNLDWMGGIDVAEASNPVLINNTVAGSERVAFNIKGESCSDPNVWANNVAHSSYHGVHILKTGMSPCTRVSDFTAYRNFDYGVYLLTPSIVEMRSLTLIDNTGSVFVSGFSPASLSHVRSDKYVLLEDSLVIGYSQGFDCDTDKVTPEGASQSGQHRPPKSPGGGNVGVFFSSFKSGPGGAPKKPFHKVMSYPTIGGQTIVRDVTFSRFNSHCGPASKVFMTNPVSGDAMHPLTVEGLTFDDTPTDNYVWIHRPSLGWVNPADCVDMDCDAHKKAMIRDLDGSLLGSKGTIIPDSAFEWDGDPRRGLGDYRIPKMMLTTPDGARIPKDDIAPNNGIIRNDDCEWEDSWQAWKCHDLDHMMMIIESMDADTEVRRVSPISLLADGYVDLINGPMDHGWCLGYTCQERISTFYSVVATQKNYEMFFTGTNPQHLRFHLLNANSSQALVLGVWYANPQRLDVYVNGLYIMPTNGEYVNGGLQWIAPGPDTNFMPSLDSMVLGENYFDRTYQTLHFLIRGSTFVEIKTTPVVITTFGVPAVEVDNFFEENLVENLANLLNIDESQIRVVEIISEARRKKRSTDSDVEVVVEIGESPAASISDGSDNSTTPAPSATEAPSSNTLDYESLLDVQSVLADEMQTGSLGRSLGVTITSMSMTDPADTPVDPTGGVRATNTTGGPANGTTTYAEQQAQEEELALSNAGQETVYLVPSTLVMSVSPGDAVENVAFGIQPKITVLDNQGNQVTQLGTNAYPWQLTASIISVTSQGIAGLIGNTTVAFENGWANYTNLGANISATDLVIEFAITYPNTSTLSVSAEAFDVAVQPYDIVAVTAPSSAVTEDEFFEVVLELRDGVTGLVVTDLAEKGYEYIVTAELSDPSNYRGSLQGDLSTVFDLDTARATFNLSIDESGYYYIIDVSMATSPASDYTGQLTMDPFNVLAADGITHTGETRSLTVRYNYDYASIAQGNEDLLAANFLNHLAPKYNATINNVQLSEGSILLTFDVTGDVDSVESQIWEDILDGDFSLTFNGQTLVADEYLLVDGSEYEAPTSSGSLPIWIIVLVIALVLIVILIGIIIAIRLKSPAHGKIAAVEEVPLRHSTTPDYDVTVESYIGSQVSLIHASAAPTVHLSPSPPVGMGVTNKHLLLDDETDSQRSTLSARSRSPGINHARRSPEVAVTALPPGFFDGQEETALADRVKLFIMVKNADGTFQKLGEIAANMVGTISQLRHDLKEGALPPKVRDKPFVILRETLKEIEPADEKKLTVCQVYTSDCILMKWLEEQDMGQLCMCGLVGQFHCSLCQKQAYCSPQCQSTDWPRHSFKCSQWTTDC
ncbi:fibrocystin-L-like [Diadema antillarum]|uniref:fibrocystin-L-like n=1 Tax=Diadema antillarum TaxID=105358 RepID=UPI003A88B167